MGRLPSLLRSAISRAQRHEGCFLARLLGAVRVPGGAVECVLLGRMDEDRWDALVHPWSEVEAREPDAVQGQGRERCAPRS